MRAAWRGLRAVGLSAAVAAAALSLGASRAADPPVPAAAPPVAAPNGQKP
jgi:hypothetical protein